MHQLIRLAAIMLASAALVACSSIPFMGPGSMDLSVRGVELDGVVSIYLIVGEDADLADAESDTTIEKLVYPDRQKKYVTFAQFKPVEPKAGEPWKIEQRLLNPNNKLIEVSVAKKAPDLHVEIDRKLLEAHPGLAALVLVNCGIKGWGAAQKITRSEIESIGSMELEVRGPTISKVGVAK